MKASGEKRGISEQSENITEREKRRAKIEKKCSEKIRAESEKNSVDQSKSSSVVQNDAERGEYPTVEGRQTIAVKSTEIWKITQ